MHRNGVVGLRTQLEVLLLVAFGGVLGQDGIGSIHVCLSRWRTSQKYGFSMMYDVEINLLKELYPNLYACSVNQNASVHSVMDSQLGGKGQIWNVRFHKGFSWLGIGVCNFFPR